MMERVERRTLLKGGLATAAGASLAGLSSCGPKEAGSGPSTHATKRVRWRLASSFPGSLDTIYGAAEVLSEHIDEMSEGNFKIHVYQAGEIVPPFGVLDAVQQGSCEVGQTGSYYYTGKNPALAFDTCVPFGLTARQQNAWLHEGGGLEQIRKVYTDFGIISFPGGNTGSQMGGWFRRQIDSLADLQGLKMRIPGLGGQVMDALGVSIQNYPGGEIFAALERGAIDATEWVGPYDDEKLGLHKIAKNYYYPGWWEPGPSLSFLVNREAWDTLPASYQAIFRTAAHAAAMAMQSRYDAKNPPALARLKTKDIAIRPFSDEILHGARDAAEQILSDEAQNDAGYAQLLDGWRKFRKDSHGWFGLAELAYARFAFEGA